MIIALVAVWLLGGLLLALAVGGAVRVAEARPAEPGDAEVCGDQRLEAELEALPVV